MSRLSPRALDVLLTAAVLVAAVTEALLIDALQGTRAGAVAVAASTSLLLLWRRRHPVWMAALLVAIVVPASATVYEPSDQVAIFFPLLAIGYAGGAYAQGRAAVAVLAILLVGVVGAAAVGEDNTAGDFYFPGALVTLCWVAGRTVRTRIRHAAELHEAAALAAEQREHDAQAAVAEERRRIAREMHDVVAHSISIMVVQAGGARRILSSDPARAEQAAARIREAGSDALAEMDTLLGVLEAAPRRAGAATLDGLGELVTRAEEAGLPVSLAIIGTRRRLPAGAELAIYRLVQEALTNAIKHAGGATTSVRLLWGEELLEVRVTDRGDGGASPGLTGAGHGLIGMRERLRLHGGEVEAGPRPGGGFEVVARLPLERSAASVR